MLQPSLLMDKLRSRHLLTRPEYSELTSLDTELKRSQRLVNDLLPAKGPGSLNRFCQVLREVPGQEHIAELIQNQSVAGDTSAKTAGTDARSTAPQKTDDLQLGSNSKESSRDRKRKHSPAGEYGVASQIARSAEMKTATFYFDEKHRSFIQKCLEVKIKAVCKDGFGIDEDNVLIAFLDLEEYVANLPTPVNSDIPVCCDIETKLAVLEVSGVEPEQVCG